MDIPGSTTFQYKFIRKETDGSVRPQPALKDPCSNHCDTPTGRLGVRPESPADSRGIWDTDCQQFVAITEKMSPIRKRPPIADIA